MKALIIGSTAGLLLAGAAYAQGAEQPATPAPATEAPAPAAQAPQAAPAPQAQPAAPAAPQFSEAEVERFAGILTEFDKIRAEHAASGAAQPVAEDPQAKEKMAAAVQQSGLSFEKYNQIATLMQSDEDLNHRIAQYMRGDESAGTD